MIIGGGYGMLYIGVFPAVFFGIAAGDACNDGMIGMWVTGGVYLILLILDDIVQRGRLSR